MIETAMSEPQQPSTKATIRNAIAGVLAAGFGVRSAKEHTRDFESGSPKTYVLVGVVATALFVLTIIGVVKLILVLAKP
jgi:hypothetical protein